MKLILTSTSEVKVRAVREALSEVGWSSIEVAPVKASSGVSEQPFGDETLVGARNRILSAKLIDSSGDLYTSIENGLFTAGPKYFDRAIIVVQTRTTEVIFESIAVEFPARYVEEARRRGFNSTTVGRVMMEFGVVQRHDDPHLDLAGVSRSTILRWACTSALRSALRNL